MTDDSAKIFFQSFLQEAVVSSSGRAGMSTLCCCPSSIPLLTMASPTLQGALKDGSGEAVVVCDMPEPCRLPSLDSCQKRFLWTNKKVDLAPHLFTGLVLQAGDAEKFPQALGFKSLDLLFILFPFSSQWPSSHGPSLFSVHFCWQLGRS